MMKTKKKEEKKRRHNTGCVKIHSIISNKRDKVLKLIKAPL
jgi:hypothetical protein